MNQSSRAEPPRGVHDMTRGSIRRHVVRMTLFVLAGMAIQTLYALVDIYWVGRLGKEAVAAVALSTNLQFVALALTQTLSVGCVALVSQAAGRKDHDEVQRLFSKAQSLSTLAGVVFLVACFALRRTYAERLAGDAKTAELAFEFLLAFIPALALQFTVIGLGAALRGLGDMKPGLIAQTASVVLNMVLAPFLIFGWGTGHPLGVHGASLASLLSTLAAVVGLSIYVLRGGTILRLRLAELAPDLAVFRRMIGIGVPSGVEFLLMSITMGIVYAVTRPFGPEAQAGYGIGSRIMQAAFMPAVATSFATAAVVGQNFGSGEHVRVRGVIRESAKLTIAFMLACTVLCQIAPAALVRAFSPESHVIEAGADYLRTISWAFVASGLVFVFAGVFQGLGNTWPSLGASALRSGLFVAIVLWLRERPDFQMHAIWLASLGCVAVQFAMQTTLLRREVGRKAPT